jgi:TonB-linked SusC/RagA family outer membrane protein
MFNKKIGSCFAALMFIFCFFSVATAQVLTIKGKVRESPSGITLPGVSVVEVNENGRQVNGVITDADGAYAIKLISATNKLRFSYISMKTKTESISGRSVINVSLEAANELTEVLISAKKGYAASTGYVNTPKRDLIGAVSSLKAETIANEPATSIDQMMQGRLAGVQIVSESGDPGAGTDIRIRGVGTISGNAQPLYIVDGIPIISTSFDPSNAGSDVARISPIADLNPNDILSIDVLKDANASAIYGARAANGVIVVTTKRGQSGVTTIIFSNQTKYTEAPRPIPVLDANEYKAMRLEAEQNNGNINPLNNDIRPIIDDPTFQSFLYYQNNTNWFEGLTQTALSQNYNLSVGGGGEAVKYNFSTSYSDDQSAFKAVGFKRFTGRFNLDYKVSEKLKLAANVFFARSKRDTYWNINGGSPLNIALTRTPLLPIFDIDLQGNPQQGYFSLPGFMDGQDNPIAYVNSVSNYQFSTNLKPNINAELDIIKDLKFRTTLSLDFVGDNGASFLPPEATGVIWNDVQFNRLQNRDNERRAFNANAFLTYGKSFGEQWRTTMLLGTEYANQLSNSLTTEAYATGTGQMRSLGAAAGYAALRSGISDESLIRMFSQAQLFYGDKYSINFGLSREGSSKFGPSNRYAMFPTAGVFWRISGEKFMEKLKFVNDLKLRYSWGETGSSGIGNYAYISQYNTGNSYGDAIGVSQNNPQLNHLKWETTMQQNIGLDMELFKKITVGIDLYEKKTRDLLYTLRLPTSSGLTSGLLINLGDLSNRGIDFDVAFDPIVPKKQDGFRWNVLFNISRNINKVTSLPGGILTFNNNYARFGSQVKEGDALGTYYGLVFKGVYARDEDAVVRDASGNVVFELDGTTPRTIRVDSENGLPFRGGDAMYEDFNHDGIINAQDRILVGNSNPDFFGGLNNTFNYKAFRLNFFINFTYGNDIINGTRYELERMDNKNNQGISVLRRWRKQGDQSDMPRALRADNRNTIGSTRWIEDGSYARLKTVTLNYRLPGRFVDKIKLSSADIYFTASNVFTVTNYTGSDPEIGLGADLALSGVERGGNPRQKAYLVGLNVKF